MTPRTDTEHRRPVCPLAAALLALLLALAAGETRAACANLSPVLAIDASASIDHAECTLQQFGYAKALTDPAVQQALADAGAVELAALYWADAALLKPVIQWHRVESPDDVARFAARQLSTSRLITGDTAIGSGLDAALGLLDLPHRITARAVVNLSGDGRASTDLPRRRTMSPAAPASRQSASP